MAGLLTVSSVLLCPHGGTVTISTQNARTKAGGDHLVRSSDTFLIAGCPFVLGASPHPCVQVQWVEPATESSVIGDPTLTEESVGLCLAGDGAVQGVVQVVTTQPLVSGR